MVADVTSRSHEFLHPASNSGGFGGPECFAFSNFTRWYKMSVPTVLNLFLAVKHWINLNHRITLQRPLLAIGQVNCEVTFNLPSYTTFINLYAHIHTQIMCIYTVYIYIYIWYTYAYIYIYIYLHMQCIYIYI